MTNNFIKYATISVAFLLIFVFISLANIAINKIKESNCDGTFIKNFNAEYSSCIMEKKNNG